MAAESGMQASVASITFTPANFFETQAVVFTAIPNDLIDFNRTQIMKLTFDDTFTTWTYDTIKFYIADNDAPELRVTTSVFTLKEGASLETTFFLATKPAADVVLTLFSVPSQFSVSPAVVTFTETAYQNISVIYTAVLDNVVEGAMVFQRSMGTVTTADPAYTDVVVPLLGLTILETSLNVSTVAPLLGFRGGGGTVTLTFDKAVTLNLAAVESSDMQIIEASSLDDSSPLWPMAQGNAASPGTGLIFVRSFQCRWGVWASVPTTMGTVLNRRQISCPVPACIENPTNATEACLTPLALMVRVSSQLSEADQAPLYYYVWGRNDPLVSMADDVYATQITGISPLIGSMSEPTLLTVMGFNFAVTPDRVKNPPDVTVATPWCRIGGFLVSNAYWVDASNHSLGIVCVAPVRPDLTGSTKLQYVSVEISFNRYEYFQDTLITYAYRDMQRLRNTDAWTIFFVIVNVFLVIYIFLLLKSWICATFFRRCQRQDETEEEDYDIRGPKPVSNFFKARIEEVLLVDAETRERLRKEAEVDMDMQHKLRAAGYADETEDSKTRRKREEAEQLARDTAAEADEVATQREMAAQARVGRKSVLKREESRKSVSRSVAQSANSKAGAAPEGKAAAGASGSGDGSGTSGSKGKKSKKGSSGGDAQLMSPQARAAQNRGTFSTITEED